MKLRSGHGEARELKDRIDSSGMSAVCKWRANTKGCLTLEDLDSLWSLVELGGYDELIHSVKFRQRVPHVTRFHHNVFERMVPERFKEILASSDGVATLCLAEDERNGGPWRDLRPHLDRMDYLRRSVAECMVFRNNQIKVFSFTDEVLMQIALLGINLDEFELHAALPLTNALIGAEGRDVSQLQLIDHLWPGNSKTTKFCTM